MRWLFRLLCALSLLLCIFTAIFWFRSYELTDRLNWQNSGGPRSVYSAEGRLMVDLFFIEWSDQEDRFYGPQYQQSSSGPPFNYIQYLGPENDDVDVIWERSGLIWYERHNTRLHRTLIIAGAPFWMVTAATLVLPVFWIGRRMRSSFRRRRLERKGLCINCGYDLRGTPRGSACPECGLSGLAAMRGKRWDMSRVLRHLFAGLCGLSLVLYLATVIFWIRSYYVSELVGNRSRVAEQSLYTAKGYIVLEVYHDLRADLHHPGLFVKEDLPGRPTEFLQDVVASQDTDFHWQRAGFAWYEMHFGSISTTSVAIAPFWGLSLITGVLPFIWTAARLRSRQCRRRLKAQGRCEDCGYDLRATLSGNPSPECGKVDRTRTLAEQAA